MPKTLTRLMDRAGSFLIAGKDQFSSYFWLEPFIIILLTFLTTFFCICCILRVGPPPPPTHTHILQHLIIVSCHKQRCLFMGREWGWGFSIISQGYFYRIFA